ncbi:hypothetical protein GCM10008956_19560 [Deinococcus arenae]|uniref:DUF485 domain-containing protein n=2 Tax=Deinococcus TaxID=1298 RepID=A0A8H9GT49_9DEIO|nr:MULTISPECIES: DUF485 domain-containing protein [Deinococcus]ALW89752.1 hypothetical protein AUC44_13275 [Deinococcus actinosclerus]AWT36497.1 DUF485 domain-containing protein [Deinococcus actinosclerus]GGM43268.1 hypothetical protein GCM10008956_19560 [Deinococcus arenae]
MTVSSAPPAARNAAYQQLVAQRNAFTLTMTLTFLVLYFLLPVLAGYNKPLMATKVFGNVTFGYVLAFAEFIMGWVMAYIYVVKARTFDRLAQEARA